MVAIALICPLIVGCSEYVGGNSPKGAVGVGLAAKAPHVGELATVNSLGIAPVQFKQTDDIAMVKDINHELLKAFQAETLMDVKALPSNAANTRTDGKRARGRQLLTDTAVLDDKQLISSARALDADAVLLTSMHSLSKRAGSAAGSASSAEVGFTMRMVRTSDGMEVWNAVYSFSDKALSDNLLELRSRVESPGWMRAQEIIKSAFASAAHDFNEKRLTQFVSR